ncbi:hypothetical protein BA763_10725 [Burkholderia cenocepacia]|nr:hypothetical protein [Burkholderia cenocepacia]ODN63130.1 hypothetical protein BA763_10725 [Burkholderia cenocepacia]
MAAIVITLPVAAGAFAALPIETSSVPPELATVPIRVFTYWSPFTSWYTCTTVEPAFDDTNADES